jgi:LmbE family N-acetylglucosaminyl deacetylase
MMPGCKIGLVVFLFTLSLLLSPAVRAESAPTLDGLLSRTTRLIVISPHPDDETLGAGGLIQRVLGLKGAVKVVFMTSGDGYPEGVEMEEHISHPTAQDFREYGVERQEEAVRVLETLGMKKKDIIFLGFPDGGLCSILMKYPSDNGPDYKSPFTLEDRPPPSDVILPNTEYNVEDLERAITQVLTDFRPTLIVTTHLRDQHPDHHATYFYVKEALKALEKKDAHRKPKPRPQLLTFLIHFGQWPLDGGGGTGSHLNSPQGFPEKDMEWISFPLSPEEVDMKRRALLQYPTQMLIMGRYILSFARGNELFAFDRPRTAKEIEELRPCLQEERIWWR